MTPNYLNQEQRDRYRQMENAWRAYAGEFPRPLKVRPGQSDDNVLTNRCAPIVDKGVSFLFGNDLHITVEHGAAHGAQDYLDLFWQRNRQMTTLAKLATNGAICGHAFVKIVPSAGTSVPRIIVLDPAMLTVETEPDDCETITAINIDYPGLSAKGEDVTIRERIERVDPDGSAATGAFDDDCTWTIVHLQQSYGASDFTPIDDPVAWPHRWPPVLGCQNLPATNTFWGKPDLTPDIIGMNEVINFVQSNTSRIIKHHAHPKTWSSGVAAQNVDISVDNLISLPEGAKLANLEMHSDLASSLHFAETLRADMDEQSRVPAVALGRLEGLPKGNISGVALQLLFQPLLEKTRLKQLLYGELIEDICAAVIELGGFGVDVHVEINWPNLLPVDDLAAAQTALALKQLGVSDQTIMSQLGYDADEEMQKSQVEDAKKLVNFSRGQGMPPTPQLAQPMTPTPTNPPQMQDEGEE